MKVDLGGHVGASCVSDLAGQAACVRRTSIAVQRSMTTDNPPARVVSAASRFTTPICRHRHLAPAATASSECGTHSSDRRKTSTISTGLVAATAAPRSGTP